MGNKLSLKTNTDHSEVHPQVKTSEQSKQLNPKQFAKQPFSCGVFRRKPSSIFLDYDGLSFDEYFKKKGARNSLGTTSLSNQSSILSTSSQGDKTVYSKVECGQMTPTSELKGESQSENGSGIYSEIKDTRSGIYSEIKEPHASGSQLYVNSLKNQEANMTSYESIADPDGKSMKR